MHHMRRSINSKKEKLEILRNLIRLLENNDIEDYTFNITADIDDMVVSGYRQAFPTGYQHYNITMTTRKRTRKHPSFIKSLT